MARLARKQLADMRAMEEEAERVNPVMKGKGATPSMGLSQIRGGRKGKKSLSAQIEADEHAAPSLYIEEMDKESEMPSGEYDGGAKHRGALLGSYISKMKGGAYLKDFMAGMGTNTGAYEGEGKMSGGAGIVGGGKLEITHGSDSDEECEAPKGGAKPKRIVGAGDGRRRRAEVVKKVMREKGMSMIEASKYVKQHGLYK